MARTNTEILTALDAMSYDTMSSIQQLEILKIQAIANVAEELRLTRVGDPEGE